MKLVKILSLIGLAMLVTACGSDVGCGVGTKKEGKFCVADRTDTKPAQAGSSTSAEEEAKKKSKAEEEAKKIAAKADEENKKLQAQRDAASKAVEGAIQAAFTSKKLPDGMLAGIAAALPLVNGDYSTVHYSVLESPEYRHAEFERYSTIGLVLAQQDLKLTEMFVDQLAPYIRVKHPKFVEVAKRHDKILRTSFTLKTFEKMIACVDRNDKARILSECEQEFKKWGLSVEPKATLNNPGDTQINDESPTMNETRWVIKFLHRRALNGGDKFAQFTQKMALKVANP